MKKYKTIKKIGYTEVGSLFNNEGRYIGHIRRAEKYYGMVNVLIKEMIKNIKDFSDYIEEIEEESSPKFKIGDGVTFYNDDNKIFGFIAGFDTFSNEYKISTDTRWYKEDELTLTKEEDIKKYFKQ